MVQCVYCYVSMNVIVSDATVERLPNWTASVSGKRYRIAKCAAKSSFCEAKSTLHRKVLRINFISI